MRSEPSPGWMAEYRSGERDLLRAVRDLVRADEAMRAAARARMGLGDRDMRALRFVLAAAHGGAPAAPHELADHLGISTAATTSLLDRLAAAGHVERLPHPSDRRAKVVLPTAHAEHELRRELSAVHHRMRAAARAVPPAQRAAVAGFLRALTEVMTSDAARR